MMTTTLKRLFAHPLQVATFGLGAVHFFGIAGLLSPWRDLFLSMTPLTLLLACAAMLAFHPAPADRRLLAALAATFSIGFAVEVTGVATGRIFGIYWYGDVLGYKVWQTPLLIGVNWLLLAYGAGMITNRLFSRLPLWGKAGFGALLMVGLDVLIEPVAIRLGFWQWAGGTPPLQNYVAWFVAGFVILLLLHTLIPAHIRNPFAIRVFGILAAFFGALNLLLP